MLVDAALNGSEGSKNVGVDINVHGIDDVCQAHHCSQCQVYKHTCGCCASGNQQAAAPWQLLPMPDTHFAL